MNRNIFVDECTVFNPEKGEFETLPEILYFTIDKNILTDETPAIVSWSVTNATLVKLNDELVAPVGSKDFHTGNLLSIMLFASNDAGETPVQTLLLDIDSQPPIIKSFKIEAPFVVKGIPFALSWDVQGAKQIEIDNGIGDVSNLNSKMITLKEKGEFNLTAKNYFGINAEEKATVSVFPTPAIESIFIPVPEFSLPDIVYNQPQFNMDTIPLNQPLFSFQKKNVENTNRPAFTEISQLVSKIFSSKKMLNSIPFLGKRFKILFGKKN